MRILLDESVPQAAVTALRAVMPGHEVEHAADLGWQGDADRDLLPQAAAAGYDVIVTTDTNQVRDPDACRAIRASGLHHVRFPGTTGRGVRGLARTLAALIAAGPGVVAALERAGGQRLVRVRGVSPHGRFAVTDPARNPPQGWEP